MEEEGGAAWADQAAHKLLLLAFMGKIGHKQGVVARGCVLPALLAPGEGRAPGRWDELAPAAFTAAPLHTSSRAVFGTRRRKENKSEEMHLSSLFLGI